MDNKVELLAPAGNYEAFRGAVNAGADAVYLGGDRFGARAYADNFTDDEICRALHEAHFMGRKIYLTVNTLMKDRELEGLYDWLRPFYESGLDGVIVQDIGVLCRIREAFPDLALHASTQMSLTGAAGAAFLQAQGVSRIVPARELSLAEIREIKAATGLEIECFVHGAMCYCYSGQCLFSSILGGRSGNRGRCAQPCRLPYDILEDGVRIDGIRYPLSLKDMCTAEYIPQLIEAGIDSFKIEGRMKKPEYAAGVTAVYRKCIDLYAEKGQAGYRVASEDRDRLRSLYIRSEVQNGYYERHNGREMITLNRPGYAGSGDELLAEIRDRYIRRPWPKRPVNLHITLQSGAPSVLTVTDRDGLGVSVTGAAAEKAQKKPLQREDIVRQLTKTGNTLVEAAACDVSMADSVFLPISALNELRRRGIEAYERQYIEAQGGIAERRSAKEARPAEDPRLTKSVRNNGEISRHVLVSSYEQLAVAAEQPCRRIYIESDLFLAAYEKVTACMRAHDSRSYYLALPYILRARDQAYLASLASRVRAGGIDGFLIRNYEAAAYVETLGRSYDIVPDAGLYVFNREGLRFWSQYARTYTLPYELNAGECRALTERAHAAGIESTLIVYGRIPMMISANCVRRTAGRCPSADASGRAGQTPGKPVAIRDRYGTDFPVETNCIHCYNVIYNAVPYSLHMQRKELPGVGADIWRYDFTVESGAECGRILAGGGFPGGKYTTGHFKRGVE